MPPLFRTQGNPITDRMVSRSLAAKYSNSSTVRLSVSERPSAIQGKLATRWAKTG